MYVFMVGRLKLYSRSKFQFYNVLLPTIVTVPDIGWKYFLSSESSLSSALPGKRNSQTKPPAGLSSRARQAKTRCRGRGRGGRGRGGRGRGGRDGRGRGGRGQVVLLPSTQKQSIRCLPVLGACPAFFPPSAPPSSLSPSPPPFFPSFPPPWEGVP